jgi:6-phosphogluconolactonase (cycloisomerase 2 family)
MKVRLCPSIGVIARLAFCIILTGFTLSAERAHGQFLYIHDDSISGNRIFGFSVTQDGNLVPIPGSPFLTGGLGELDFDINSINVVTIGNRLYSANVGTNSISGFNINLDGSLTPILGSPFPLTPNASPIAVCASSNGQLLFVGRGAGFGVGTGIEVFNIASNGALTLVAGSPFGAGLNGNGFDVVFDPFRNKVISNQNDNHLSVFDVGPTGVLSQITGSPFETLTFNNHKMSLSPNGAFLFVAGGGLEDVSVMSVDPDGTLINAPGSPVRVAASTIATAVHPSGAFVYFGEEGLGGNITGFNLSFAGNLTPIAGSPFVSGGESPTGIVTDNFGILLFAANTFSRDISVMRVAQNGGLSHVLGSPFAFQFNGNPTGIAYVGSDFDICLRDESSDSRLLLDSSTGAYQFTNCSGVMIAGVARATRRGCFLTFEDNFNDRRLLVKMDTCQKRGTAILQSLATRITYAINDRNTANNICACSTGAQ